MRASVEKLTPTAAIGHGRVTVISGSASGFLIRAKPQMPKPPAVRAARLCFRDGACVYATTNTILRSVGFTRTILLSITAYWLEPTAVTPALAGIALSMMLAGSV
jgi:hypothetical protein